MKEKLLNFITPVFHRIEKLPKARRILFSCLIFFSVIGGTLYFSILPKYQEIEIKAEEFEGLSRKLVLSKRNAAQHEKYAREYKDREAELKIAMKALPEQKEIPSLLGSVSQSGQDVNLKFLLFQPKTEERKDFYAEIPVAVEVAGAYHNIALFFEKVAGLSRIVNIRDIQMTAPKEGAAQLTAACTAVTYMFMETPPAAPAKGKEAAKK
jgi:type IV pilus assembly protein PilO